MSKLLHEYIEVLKNHFKSESDYYVAHKNVAPILKEMAMDKSILHEVIYNNMMNEDYVKKLRHYPTIAFDIYSDPNFTLVANCFLPLPTRSVDKTFQSIHHHGNLLLTTQSAFGSGYESIVYKKGFTINENQQTNLEIEKKYQFHLYDTEFIDVFQPHVVFFPSELSITYALWSNVKSNKVKNNPLVQQFKKPIKSILNILGVSKSIGINIVENYDFYRVNNSYIALKNRIEFAHGTNENFIQNIAYIMQEVGFNEMEKIEKIKSNHHSPIINEWMNKLINKEKVSDSFYEFHQNVKYVNLERKDLLA